MTRHSGAGLRAGVFGACRLLSILVITWAAALGTGWALELRITGEQLTVHAKQVPLQQVLHALARQGIRVKVDRDIDPLISASLEDVPLQQGLDSIFRHLNHIYVWERITAAQGSLERLAEIQIFRPGQRSRMVPLAQRPVLDVAKDPRTGAYYVRHEVLIRLKPGIDMATFRKLLAGVGGRVIDAHPAVGIYKIRVPDSADIPALVGRLGNNATVNRAEPNYAYPLAPPRPVTLAPAGGGLPTAAPPPAGGIPVAVLDSGLSPGTAADSFVVASLDAVNAGEHIDDTLGHGTQMALIASGAVSPAGTTTNIAAAAPIIPIRAFDNNGRTSNFQLMQSIDFALAHGARVMSLSWGTDTASRFLEDAMNYARAKGMFIVASAGNTSGKAPHYPAAYDATIAVGALTPEGDLWQRSNSGDFVDLQAPGFAQLPVGYRGDPGAYAGTSIATAYTANRVAAILAANPDADQQEMISLLKNTRKD